MPVPGGIISTSTGPVDPSAPVEKPVAKKKAKLVEEALPEVEAELDQA